ncbi:hypothetical protein Tco_0935263 [Tanacetum coccineum]
MKPKRVQTALLEPYSDCFEFEQEVAATVESMEKATRTMTTVNQGMSAKEIKQVVAQRVANAIEAIAIYEIKTNMTRNEKKTRTLQECCTIVKFQNRVDMYWKGEARGDSSATTSNINIQ